MTTIPPDLTKVAFGEIVDRTKAMVEQRGLIYMWLVTASISPTNLTVRVRSRKRSFPITITSRELFA